MKVLIAVHGFPPTHIAGAERQAERTALWLLGSGHRVEVFAIESASADETRLTTTIENGLTVHRLYYNVTRHPDPVSALYDSPIVGSALRAVLARGQFDLLHVISGYLFGTQAVEAARERGIPVVISPTEYWFMCKQLNLLRPSGRLCSGPETELKCASCALEEKRRFRWLAMCAPSLSDTVLHAFVGLPFARKRVQSVKQRTASLQRCLSEADALICNSQFMMQFYRRFGYSMERCRVIRLGLVKPEHTCTRPSGVVARELRLGYLGQVKFHKGVDLLIDAVLGLLREGHAVRLDLWDTAISATGYARKLKSLSAARSEIHWNQPCDPAGVWQALARVDVLVVPSRWYENSPAVILEAHAAGVVVVCAQLGGMAELVHNEEWGLTFRHNDVAHLQTQLRRLLVERGLLERLRGNLPQVRSIDEEMAEVVDVYREVLRHHRVQFSHS